MVRNDNEIYEIENIIKKQKGKLLVKWKGYQEPSWINGKRFSLINLF